MQIVIKSTKGNAVTTSLLVAEKFGKRHSDVLRAIRDSLSLMPENERKSNFALCYSEISLPNGGYRSDPYYVMTKDGFSIIVLGFTGAKAMAGATFLMTSKSIQKNLKRP